MDDYSRHEALHVASMVADIVEDHLTDHQYIQANPELRKRSEEVADKLMEIYQIIGQEHFS